MAAAASVSVQVGETQNGRQRGRGPESPAPSDLSSAVAAWFRAPAPISHASAARAPSYLRPGIMTLCCLLPTLEATQRSESGPSATSSPQAWELACLKHQVPLLDHLWVEKWIAEASRQTRDLEDKRVAFDVTTSSRTPILGRRTLNSLLSFSGRWFLLPKGETKWSPSWVRKDLRESPRL